MTEYGSPYEGEGSKKGEQTAATTSEKGLDPVCKEDKDVDNDGDRQVDKYLLSVVLPLASPWQVAMKK